MGDAAAPTIDDARRAGQALTDAGAREVMVFGSVAKGEARPYSDIDLVVVFDDLGYRMRRDTAYALEDLAADAVGQPVDVWLTDVPEWAAQNRCAASFAAAIRADLMPVAVRRGDDSAIRWDKEQVMATSDTEAAWRHRPVRQLQDVLESGVRRPGRTTRATHFARNRLRAASHPRRLIRQPQPPPGPFRYRQSPSGGAQLRPGRSHRSGGAPKLDPTAL